MNTKPHGKVIWDSNMCMAYDKTNLHAIIFQGTAKPWRPAIHYKPL